MFKRASCLVFVFLLHGCASIKFSANENNEYTMQKSSDACAAGMPSKTLDFLRQEAVKFCAGRKEITEEISTDEVIGIPIIRCAEATLRFRCKLK